MREEDSLLLLVDKAPADMRDELLALQKLTVVELKQVAFSQIPLPQQERHLTLLEKNSAGAITAAEEEELVRLRVAADRLMLCKAYAWAVLRWRGEPIPALAELPTFS